MVLVERPRINPISYFGQDSFGSATHIFPPALPGSLPGSLQRTRHSSVALCWPRQEVVAVELNPVAAAYAQINAMINDVEDKIEVRVGDLDGLCRMNSLISLVLIPLCCHFRATCRTRS